MRLYSVFDVFIVPSRGVRYGDNVGDMRRFLGMVLLGVFRVPPK